MINGLKVDARCTDLDVINTQRTDFFFHANFLRRATQIYLRYIRYESE